MMHQILQSENVELEQDTIQTISEESECIFCGCALYVGDIAYYDINDNIYCSVKCAQLDT
jgi:hypothetical protein